MANLLDLRLWLLLVLPAVGKAAEPKTACVSVEPGVSLDGVALGERRPELLTPEHRDRYGAEWWGAVGRSLVQVNAEGVVNLIRRPLAADETCIDLKVGEQRVRVDLSPAACVEIPIEGCQDHRFDEEGPLWWDCSAVGFKLLNGETLELRIAPPDQTSTLIPPSQFREDGCALDVSYAPLKAIFDPALALPPGTIGLGDGWMGRIGYDLCTPGASPEAIQRAFERSLRAAGFVEEPVESASANAKRCHPEHTWSRDGVVYWITLLGGPRWQVTRCPRCEWEETHRPAVP